MKTKDTTSPTFTVAPGQKVEVTVGLLGSYIKLSFYIGDAKVGVVDGRASN